MKKKAVAYYIGRILLIEAICMIPSIVICLSAKDFDDAAAFGVSVGILAVVGGLLSLFKQSTANGIHAREGFATVALGWISMSFFGSLPFYISRSIPRFIDAWFETVSGFTTTGSTILSDVESLSAGMLYWRSFILWLGGMGVLVFMLAIVPLARGTGESMHILRAESPGPVISKLVPKMRSTARLLYLIYLVLTIMMTVMLVAGGMPVFDSITTALSTAGTGGFSIRNASIGHYNSMYLQTVVAVFMLVFGVNFSIFHLALLREFKSILKNKELRVYLGVVAVSTAVIALNILSLYENFGQALHQSFFNVSSIITTTGFTVSDLKLWPQFSKTLLLLLMISGACAGSTSGGFKISRWVILIKSARCEIKKLLHPRSVHVIKIDGKVVDQNVISGVNGYFVVYILLFAASILLISLDNPDFSSAFSSVAGCINNVGFTMNADGFANNFSFYSDFSKIILSLDMLLGRLEIYPILLVFSPVTWLRGK